MECLSIQLCPTTRAPLEGKGRIQNMTGGTSALALPDYLQWTPTFRTLVRRKYDFKIVFSCLGFEVRNAAKNLAD
jgi:hypothetical protein